MAPTCPTDVGGYMSGWIDVRLVGLDLPPVPLWCCGLWPWGLGEKLASMADGLHA
jgi:hypothetical protein